MDNPPTLGRPIFEVGCAKSGTTFLSLLLSMHPEVGPDAPDASQYKAQEYLNAMLDEQLFEPVAHRIERKEVWDRYFPMTVPLRIGAELTMYKNPLNIEQTNRLIGELTGDLIKPRFLSKAPFNTFRIHVLREIFPECKLIAIHRDGRDVIASWGRKANRWETFGGYHKAIEIFARKWNESIDHIEAYKDELDILTLRYEDLVTNLPCELQRVLDHCQLDYLPHKYDSLIPQPQVGKWIEIIPTQYHRLCNDLTTRNRHRLRYTDSEFDFSTTRYSSQSRSTSFLQSFSLTPKAVVPCPLCDFKKFETLSRQDRHNIELNTSMCQNCGLIMNNPRPQEKWYKNFYENWFWSLYIGQNANNLDELYVQDKCANKGTLIGKQILKEIDSEHLNYLDIGCGLGGLIKFFERNRLGWNISGFDPSKEAVDFLSRRTEADIRKVSLDNLEGEEENYDIITMVHVLEHTLDPVKVLTDIEALLKPAGLIYIEVPNFMSPNWNGKNFLHIAHNFIFDQLSLNALLEKVGLRAVRFIQSPVQDQWPWAIGVFARKREEKASNEDQITSISDEELQRRRDWMNLRLENKVASAKCRSMRCFLSEHFPLSRRMFRALKAGWQELRTP